MSHADDERSDADVFEAVFKRRQASALVPVALLVNGSNAGTIVLDVRTETEAYVSTDVILAALRGSRVRSETLHEVSRASRDGKVSLDRLRSAKLAVDYDPNRLDLQIRVDADLTEQVSHTLAPGMPAGAEDAIQPSDLSGYVNLYGRGGTATPDHARLESVLNIHRWVLEARGEFGEAPIGIHRGDVLLSRDVPESALRLLAGDFAVAAAGPQPGFPVLGIGVTRNFALQPYRIVQPVGVFQFTLERPSHVTVLVNGAPVQTLELPAGRHDVRDLPLAAGQNDVELLVRDGTGAERRLQFSATNPAELLAPGIVQFSLTLGFPLIEDAGFRSYQWSRPIISGRRRWGVTDRLTIGASVDGDFDRHVGGTSVAVATKLGNLALDLGGSRDRQAGLGHVESLRYDYYRSAGGTATNALTLIARRYTSGFRSLSVSDLDARYAGDISAASSVKLDARTFARLGARYQFGRDMSASAYDASITLSRAFEGFTLDTLVGTKDSADQSRDLRVFFSARWTLPKRKGTAYAFVRTSTDAGTSNELRFTTRPAPAGGTVASATVRESREAYGGDVTLTHTHERFIASATGSGVRDRMVEQTGANGSLELGTAFAFASGRTAWTRPITGSFVIVDGTAALRDQELGVNPVAGQFTARSNRLGPAVVAGLEPYRLGTVRVEAPHLRVGTSLGPSNRTLLPAYKTGALLLVGEPGTVFLRGTLQHANGTPVAFAAAELVVADPVQTAFRCDDVTIILPLQDRADCLSERPTSARTRTLSVLTNQAGRFSVMGVVPGRYVIRSSAGTSTTIDIPANHSGLYAAGSLVVR